MGCHSLLQGILTQGSTQGLLHCRQSLYCLSPRGHSFSLFLLFPPRSLHVCPHALYMYVSTLSKCMSPHSLHVCLHAQHCVAIITLKLTISHPPNALTGRVACVKYQIGSWKVEKEVTATPYPSLSGVTLLMLTD